MTTVNYNTAENIAYFLFSQTETFNKVWQGRLKKSEQMEIFGQYFGKGLIVINPIEETVTHVVKVCYGTDTSWTAHIKWDGTDA